MSKAKLFFLYFGISAACAGIWSLIFASIVPAGCAFPVVFSFCLFCLCWNYEYGHHA